MKPVIPAVLYMSLRTGQLVERPSHEGWTLGDVRQWEDQHVAFRPPHAQRAATREAVEKALVAAALVCRGTRDCMDPRNEGSSRELLETMADAIDDLDVEEFLP